jgi:hypothetical protein
MAFCSLFNVDEDQLGEKPSKLCPDVIIFFGSN